MRSPHSCLCELQTFKNAHKFSVANENNFRQLFHLFSSLSFPPVPFIFWPTHYLFINTLSSKLWWPITTIFCVPFITTWKHLTSSLWMNASDLILWMFYIHNPPKLSILIPCYSPCMPFTNCANTSIDCVYTSANYANIFTNCAHTSITMPTPLMIVQIYILIHLMPLIHQI